MQFRKKQLVVEAEQYNGNNNPFGAAKVDALGRSHIKTMHDGQTVVLEVGDWVIPDGKPGTYYPCKADVFAKTYQPVDESPSTELQQAQARIKELEEALRGLFNDVRSKPNDTRYTKHLKIAETTLIGTGNTKQ